MSKLFVRVAVPSNDLKTDYRYFIYINQSMTSSGQYQLMVKKILPDDIYKNSVFTQLFSIKDLKFFLNEWHQRLGFDFSLILLSAIQNTTFKKNSYKKYLITISEFGNGKIIFILNYKIIIVYVEPILVYIEDFRLISSFYGLFYSPTIGSIILVSPICKDFFFYNYLNDLLKIIFGIFESQENNNTRSKIRSFKSGKSDYKFVESLWKSKKLLHFLVSTGGLKS